MMLLESLWMRLGKMGRLLHPVAEKQMQDDTSKSFHAGPWQGEVCKVKIKPGTIVNGRRASLQCESCFHTTQLEH